MRFAIPTTPTGHVDKSWGRAPRVTVAQVEDGMVTEWLDFDVQWDRLHDVDGEGGHHALIARFLLDHKVDRVAAQHMGPGMTVMLAKMRITVDLGVSGDGRAVALESAGRG